MSESKQAHSSPRSRKKTEHEAENQTIESRGTVIVQKLLMKKCHVRCRAKRNTKGQSKDMCTSGHTKKKQHYGFNKPRFAEHTDIRAFATIHWAKAKFTIKSTASHLLNLQITFNEMSNVWF